MSDDISDEELEELYDKIDAENAQHPLSEEDLKREINRLNDSAPQE